MNETSKFGFNRATLSRNIPKTATCLQDLKDICKAYGIRNSTDYRKKYKDIPGLIAHPERTFTNEWVSYRDFFDLPDFPSYDEVVTTISSLNLKNANEYKKFVRNNPELNFPLDPQGVYSNEWENWYRFRGQEEPCQPQFIPREYGEWRRLIEEFMKQARGGQSKVTSLCRFVREFIQKQDKSKSPQEFLTKPKVNIKPYRNYLNLIGKDAMKRRQVISTIEFLDWVIDTELTDEDEETGEIIRVLDARNPFALLTNDSSVKASKRSESTKPCLPYHFVKKAQMWLIPEKARDFSDLEHLHHFDSDWVKVNKSVVDPTDPDCVYRLVGKQYYLWSPVDWIHTLALLKVPLRGRQIAYNDSGEGDEEIAVIDDNSDKIVFIKNDSSFAGTTKKQSFISKLNSLEQGMYVTTNKTNNNGGGYSIPWIPEDLAYWLVKLRIWQQKHNPISKPTPWAVCKRTNLNEIQLKEKGQNCFLFRAFGDVEPKNVAVALTNRLAAALYNIQPQTLQLSSLQGRKNILSHYKSPYTPHSMRVSLITAYIMDMGMPVEIVMKVVGHASIVMSIYYCKVSNNDIRKRLEEGEKIALKSQAESAQKIIEQQRLEEVKNQLVANNEEVLNSLTNQVPAGNFIFRDYGICPYAASRCNDGGEVIANSNFNERVTSGYLGEQNCVRCRHFITGPAFLGGLLSITNEILLQANIQSEHCTKLQQEVQAVAGKLEEEDRKEYIANLKEIEIDSSHRIPLEAAQRKLESEYESAAKKMDILLCDLQFCYKLIGQCQGIVNEAGSLDEDSVALIKHRDSELRIELDETSHFHQLHEVCENATIFQSASAENAIHPRSQLLDKMALFNDIAPSLFLLDKEKQLFVGNQIVKLLMSRLKTWKRVDQLVNCSLKLEDLTGDERIYKSEIEIIHKKSLLESTGFSR